MLMTKFTFQRSRMWMAVASVTAAALWPLQAHALFEDDEARKAIIDLRQRFEESQGRVQQAAQDSESVRRSMVELSSQMDQLRRELAQLRGQNEELARQLSDLQRKQKDAEAALVQQQQQVEQTEQERQVSLDGTQFDAAPAEQKDYSAALDLVRRSDFPKAEMAFSSFLRVYPNSGYTPSVLYWLGNAQYANRSYREAVGTHRRLVNTYPEHPRAAEAMLATANSLLELKEKTTAKRTLEDLVKRYPSSEAAAAAKDRLKGWR